MLILMKFDGKYARCDGMRMYLEKTLYFTLGINSVSIIAPYQVRLIHNYYHQCANKSQYIKL